MKLLTIIVPTYNMSAFLDRCLTSFHLPDTEQMEQLEVLVIDDGSTDDSLSIAQRHASLYPGSIRAIHKENGNYGSCINRGLSEASGEYIKVVDADDWVNTQHLAEMMQMLSELHPDAMLSPYDIVPAKGGYIVPISIPLPPSTLISMHDVSDLAMRSVMMHATTYRTQMVRSISYHQSEGISYTDQEWVFLPMSKAKTLVYYPKAVYQYFVGRPGQTVNIKVWERNFWMELQGMRVMLEQYADRKAQLDEDEQRYLWQRLMFRNYAIIEAYFTRFRTTNNNDKMREYDLFVKQINPELWQVTGECSVFKFHFVKWWRQHNYAAHIPWLWLMAWLGNQKKEIKARYKHFRQRHNL